MRCDVETIATLRSKLAEFFNQCKALEPYGEKVDQAAGIYVKNAKKLHVRFNLFDQSSNLYSIYIILGLFQNLLSYLPCVVSASARVSGGQ